LDLGILWGLDVGILPVPPRISGKDISRDASALRLVYASPNDLLNFYDCFRH
jgi:hypothetical protein